MRTLISFFILFFTSLSLHAQSNILNIYAWSGEIPDSVVEKFEDETGIRVNVSTYDNNEIMYAKLRAVKNAGYDIVNPSSYFVDRMRRQDMLEKLDKTKLPNLKNLNPIYTHAEYDPGLQYSIPHVAGITGIFVNSHLHKNTDLTWADFWLPKYKNQLLLLDDPREVFSMALMTLGYSVNDRNPEHIKQAFLRLKKLMPNVKVFSSETVASLIIDEDATIGMAWNGDVYKAERENETVKFIFPTDGFVIWVDNLAIPKNAPHKDNAYLFLNFLLRPEIAKDIALATLFSTTNLAAQALLPEDIRNNPAIYPPKSVLDKGQFQTDIGEETASLLEKYWEELKMGG